MTGKDCVDAETKKVTCGRETSKQFRVTEWGDIVPTDISDEKLEALRKARTSP